MGGNCQCERNGSESCGPYATVAWHVDVEVEQPSEREVMPTSCRDWREHVIGPQGMDATLVPFPRQVARLRPFQTGPHVEDVQRARDDLQIGADESECSSQSASETAADVEETPRLLLTSDGLSTAKLKNEFRRLLGDAPGDKTVWYIPTAALADFWTQRDVEKAAADLQASFDLGRVEIIDVKHVQGDALSKALAALGHVDVVWADMGNTYALRHHLRASGADDHIRDALEGGALYVGSSSGAIVAGRTVQMAFWKDWDDRTAGGAIDVDWDNRDLARGLDLAGGRSFFPHANGPYGSMEWQEMQAIRHGHTDHEVVRLRDGEAFLFEDGRCTLIS